MAANIFSTYSTGENRVTASTLAVLESLSLSRIERLLGALLEKPEFELVQFANQPSKGGKGVPDAEITSSVRLLIETKISRNALNRPQLVQHLERLEKANEAMRALLVITPDDPEPAVIKGLKSPLVAWTSFDALHQAIDGLLTDDKEVVSEREAFLLRELQALLEREKLVPTDGDVLVVPARNAWPDYGNFSAYICQPNRTFRPVKRLAFYTGGNIQPLVPSIVKVFESVELTVGKHKGPLGKLIDQLDHEGASQIERVQKVMLLSAPGSAKTIDLGQTIPNDLTADGGRTIAFTQGQRYVTLDALKIAKTTSDLVKQK